MDEFDTTAPVLQRSEKIQAIDWFLPEPSGSITLFDVKFVFLLNERISDKVPIRKEDKTLQESKNREVRRVFAERWSRVQLVKLQ